jgi:AcrR family transcriptional regulator
MTQARGDRRRAELRDAALALLDEAGMSGVTHRALADRAGMPLPSVAYYFPTKDALLEAAVDAMVDREVAQFRALSEQVELRDAPSEVIGARLAELLATLVRTARQAQLAQFEVLIHAARGDGGSAAAGWIDAYLDVTEGLLAAGDVGNPRAAARGLLAAAFGLVLFQLVDPWDDEALAEACTRLVEGVRRS